MREGSFDYRAVGFLKTAVIYHGENGISVTRAIREV
jgi:hypothetical protein